MGGTLALTPAAGTGLIVSVRVPLRSATAASATKADQADPAGALTDDQEEASIG